jgi:hypothetical protein
MKFKCLHTVFKKRYIWIVIILIPCVGRSQESHNAIYAELLGPGILYSVNYERFINSNLTIRVGASVFTLNYNSGGDQSTIFVFPIIAYYLSGTGSSKLEIGAGTDVLVDKYKSYGDIEPFISPEITSTSGVLLVGSVGYRYQPSEGGFHFRIVANPIISPYTGYIIPSIGCSLGMCF